MADRLNALERKNRKLRRTNGILREASAYCLGSAKLSARARDDRESKSYQIARVFLEKFAIYDVRKIWQQVKREGYDIAQCTVARLIHELGWAEVIRGKPVRTAIGDKAVPCPLDRAERQFYAPAANRLWFIGLHIRRDIGLGSSMSPS